jgi:hypothetical protein
LKKGSKVKLGKISTLKIVSPAVHMGISGTGYCEEDDDE